MTDVLEFLGSLLDAGGLLGVALAVGGCVHVLLILRRPREPAAAARVAVQRALRAATWGAALLTVARVSTLAIKPLALAGTSGPGPYTAFLATYTFRAGLTDVFLAAVLALLLGRWRAAPESSRRRGFALAGLGVLLAHQAWLSHGVSRLEGGGSLMAMTVVHLTAATLWAGGVAHLMILWWQIRRDDAATPLWSLALTRFSALGIAAMLLVLLAGTFLATSYVGSPAGLVGSSYGNMILAKIVLLAMALALAAGNLSATRRWRRVGAAPALWNRVPAHVEVELVLGAALLVTAASLTSYPPPVDVPEQTATPSEIWEVFAPKVPVLTGPQPVWVESLQATDLHTGAVGHEIYLDWDNFNHNLSGVIVLAMALLALLDWSGRARWASHWPLALVAFSALIVLFANPGHWPLGRRGFLESLQDVEWLQHMAAAVVVLGLGVFEWRARRVDFVHPRLRFVFPLLCIVGGLILLTHSHGTFEGKNDFLIQSTHVVMGLFGVVMGCARWLELRLPHPRHRAAGLVSILAMAVVGVTLLFYVDPGMVLVASGSAPG